MLCIRTFGIAFKVAGLQKENRFYVLAMKFAKESLGGNFDLRLDFVLTELNVLWI